MCVSLRLVFRDYDGFVQGVVIVRVLYWVLCLSIDVASINGVMTDLSNF